MPVCSRNGCKKEYIEEENVNGACKYHAGGPVFHEGLKSWSCCPSKKEMEFEQFMKIEGCEEGSHVPQPPKPHSPVVRPNVPVNTPLSSDGVTEVFSSGPSAPPASILPAAPSKPVTPAPVLIEEEDDHSIQVVQGTQCKRNGCRVEFVSDEVNRIGEGEGAICTYHPGNPLFHEGSKGYFCCKRRVLEFDEFLKIEGCKTGRHLFAPTRSQEKGETQAACRIDHYQTPQQVCVSVFAKQADKARSSVAFEEEKVLLDLFLPNSKRFTRTLELFGPIDPTKSNFSIMGTKVEINLQKADGRSWNLLEKTDRDLGSFNLTFGVGGRTGTIGSKEAILSNENKIAA